jgi:hypothetical protein
MTTDTNQLVKFSVSQAALAKWKSEYAKLEATTPNGYQETTIARREVRTARTTVEKERVKLKADALAWGRAVDAAAKKITDEILEIENPLSEKLAAVDDERQRRIDALKAEDDRRLAEAAERVKREEEARLQAIRDAELAKMKAEREQLEREKAKHAEEQELMREYLAEQRAEEEAERKAKQDALDAQAEQQRLAQAKIDRERAELETELRRQQETAQKVVREQEEKKQADLARLKKIAAESAEAERKEALKPDREKLEAFAMRLRVVKLPEDLSDEARGVLNDATDRIEEIAQYLEQWEGQS